MYYQSMYDVGRHTPGTALPLLLLLLALLSGCTLRTIRQPPDAPLKLDPMGYTIQIGAFSVLDNAVRLTNSLEAQGVEAYYFVHRSGLYKVRFGNFPTKEGARRVAEGLLHKGIIADFYIVAPDSYPAARQKQLGRQYLRRSIVSTARSFLGVEYRWGGTDPENGFDCSGLTMAVFQLNGLDLPRTSRQQYARGIAVSLADLLPGDLLFFATGRKPGRVTHVGIYAGNNRFVHAPGKGKKITVASLKNGYFREKIVGARRYL